MNTNPNPWVKLLYINQSDQYPDNYVDSSFLASMQKNVHVRTWDYWTVLISSGSVTQHIDSIIMFIILFGFLYMDYITTFHVFIILFIVVLVGSLSWIYLHESIKSQLEENLKYLSSMHDEVGSWIYFKLLSLFILYLWGLSPVLKTLTRDISSDTIWTWALISFIVNALFHDYSNNITLRHERQEFISNHAIISC